MKSSPLLSDIMPYEKFEKYGLEALTDSDLLAVLLRTGTKSMNVQELARYLLTYEGGVQGHAKSSLVNLYQLSYEQLQEIPGIGKVKALQVISFLELSRRMAREKASPKEVVSSPAGVAAYFMEQLRYEKKECFLIVFADVKCRMTGYKLISSGSLTASIVHPREVYRAAILKSASSIIAVHNHPSGDPTPSREDLQITERLKKVGELIGIRLLDHIIIGDGIYKSLREESYL